MTGEHQPGHGFAELTLGKNQLAVLPESIGQLTASQWLHREQYQLTAMPGSIGQLTALQWLYFEQNQLAALPEIIGHCRPVTSYDAGTSGHPRGPVAQA